MSRFATLRNRMSGERETIIVNSGLVESLGTTEPKILQKLSWQDFWNAMNEEQMTLTAKIMEKTRKTLGWRKKRRKRVLQEILGLAETYIIF